ncbi:MAG: AMP-binding protein [Phascolarctobacterium sp.]|nr:AMP-binding protein [Phascolarctobacterium sp.]
MKQLEKIEETHSEAQALPHVSYTSYLELIESQPASKLALVDDSQSYTYGELAAAARAVREQADFTGKAIFIHADTIAEQLIKFIAYSGTATRPIIATEVSKTQQFIIDEIPASACMGVMTSGSTGKSKLLWRDLHSWADFFAEQNRVFGVDKDTVIFCQGSLAFTGNLNIYMGVLAACGTLIVTEKFRPKSWLVLMEQYGVNTIYMIPSKLLLLPKFITEPKLAVRSIISGSQSMGRQEADKLLAVFPRTQITLYYGASELNYITYIKDDEMTDDRTLIGRPFKNVGISIKNEEIFIDTPYHVEGIELPFSLKDRGYLDEEGRLHFLGRTDDILSVNGCKVSAVKVTRALMDMAGVTEAAVLVRHVEDSDMLVAYVVEAQGYAYTKQELVRSLREVLTEYELPRQFVFLEALPRNESGKIDKLALGKL